MTLLRKTHPNFSRLHQYETIVLTPYLHTANGTVENTIGTIDTNLKNSKTY